MKYSIQCHVSHSALPKNIKNHMTLMYLGEQPYDLMNRFESQDLLRRLSTLPEVWPLKIKADDIAFYGPDNDIRVLELIPDNNLLLARAISENAVFNHGIEPQTMFTRFKPHITLTEEIELKYLNYEQITVYFPHIKIWE